MTKEKKRLSTRSRWEKKRLEGREKEKKRKSSLSMIIRWTFRDDYECWWMTTMIPMRTTMTTTAKMRSFSKYSILSCKFWTMNNKRRWRFRRLFLRLTYLDHFHCLPKHTEMFIHQLFIDFVIFLSFSRLTQISPVHCGTAILPEMFISIRLNINILNRIESSYSLRHWTCLDPHSLSFIDMLVKSREFVFFGWYESVRGPLFWFIS